MGLHRPLRRYEHRVRTGDARNIREALCNDHVYHPYLPAEMGRCNALGMARIPLSLALTFLTILEGV